MNGIWWNLNILCQNLGIYRLHMFWIKYDSIVSGILVCHHILIQLSFDADMFSFKTKTKNMWCRKPNYYFITSALDLPSRFSFSVIKVHQICDKKKYIQLWDNWCSLGIHHCTIIVGTIVSCQEKWQNWNIKAYFFSCVFPGRMHYTICRELRFVMNIFLCLYKIKPTRWSALIFPT